MFEQADLETQSAPAIRGRITGTCAGEVRVEVGSTNQARPLATVARPLGPYVLHVPRDVPLRVRWGCDPDGDGAVPPAFVSEASIGEVTVDVPLDLYVPDPAVASRHTLTVATARPRHLSAAGALAPPKEGLPSPDAPAPADAAVGPPLPDGPPADAGPPPPSGGAPPTGPPPATP